MQTKYRITEMTAVIETNLIIIIKNWQYSSLQTYKKEAKEGEESLPNKGD